MQSFEFLKKHEEDLPKNYNNPYLIYISIGILLRITIAIFYFEMLNSEKKKNCNNKILFSLFKYERIVPKIHLNTKKTGTLKSSCFFCYYFRNSNLNL